MARYDVNGRVVLITGGATGIGLETAKQLERRGAQLALVDFDAAGVERAAAELGRPGRALRRRRHRQRLDRGRGQRRPRPLRRNRRCAGGGGNLRQAAADARHLSDEDWERVIQTNLIGVWRTLRAALPDVIERKGYLLPIASLAAAVPVPMASAYSASKHAVHGLARSIRIELRHTGVDVGVGYFSVIDTRMTDMAFDEPVVQRSMLRLIPRARVTQARTGAQGRRCPRRASRSARRRVYYPPLGEPGRLTSTASAGRSRRSSPATRASAKTGTGRSRKPAEGLPVAEARNRDRNDPRRKPRPRGRDHRRRPQRPRHGARRCARRASRTS